MKFVNRKFLGNLSLNSRDHIKNNKKLPLTAINGNND